MIYQSNHQAPTMSSTRKTSPRPQHRNLQASSIKCANAKAKRAGNNNGNGNRGTNNEETTSCRGRCRVQWSEKHVKEGLVLVQEAQLARVVKTGPITEHYEIDPKPFASGQWARVYRCRSRSTGILYAAKYSSRNRFNTDCSAELRHEIALLSLCSQSPRVVKLHDVYETPKEIILVMEYAPGGDLQTLIDGDLVPLEGDVIHFVRQLAEGLAYLHERNIAHLDIKPQNLVMMGTFPECDVKLCDFEISRVILEGTEVREILGTPDYVAPEILHYEPITLAADMWSLGVTTYVLLTGFSPFGGETDQETFQNISLGEVDFPEELFEDVSAQAKDFVAKLLVLDPSARMTAKQCLRHDWLRGAPTQASPHLRRYLSKSREVLLERVVSRENLRRAALLSQTASQANLSSTSEIQDQNHSQGLQDCLLSQSEICLNNCTTGSRSSLTDSERSFLTGSQAESLNSSRTSLSCASQSCLLLNKEQTQGLLSRAQSRSQANLNHSSRNLLFRIRSLHRIQSQACLLNGNNSGESPTIMSPIRIPEQMNPTISRSREKLYGLKSLSKSQGMLDIYRSLECLRRRRKSYQRAKTEDMLPFFTQLEVEIAASKEEQKQKAEEMKYNVPRIEIKTVDESISQEIVGTEEKPAVSGSEENLDSLKSIESDTLTEDSDEMSVNQKVDENAVKSDKRVCGRQHSNASSRSNNSGTSDDKEDRSTESETEEPKYTVAQLVSAFNKHQEVASKTSLEAIMSEKRINEVTFPTGPKALRLFIPDIDITENTIIRRKTSYKPRKNWEELRKRNEKNEGVLKNFDNDSGHEDDDNEDNNDEDDIDGKNKTNDHLQNENPCTKEDDFHLTDLSLFKEANDHDTTIDEKYKQCVKDATTSKPEQKESASKYSYSNNNSFKSPISTKSRTEKSIESTTTNSVDLKDILRKTDSFRNTPKENLENLRKRTSIAKILVENVVNDTPPRISFRAKSEPPSTGETVNNRDKSGTKFIVSSSSLSSDDGACTTSSTIQVSMGLSWESASSTVQKCPGSISSPTEKDENSLKMQKKIDSDKKLWGRVCTGSYTRAMQKFTGKNIPDNGRRSMNLLNVPQTHSSQNIEKTRRKSSPAMPQCVNP